ncbi:hypothetical protein F4604DRAFT_1793591 [Suillus subluteus]|nr:hypothetical protein F4604DRAFT_1793591 [Suillus subluteus]
MLRFIVIEFVVIDWSWWIRLFLLLLEPAETKEEYVWSYSVVHTNNIARCCYSERNINDFGSISFWPALLLLPLLVR